MIRSICHQLIQWYSRGNYVEYRNGLKDPKSIQLKILKSLTGISSYDEYKNNFPVTEYTDWKDIVEESREKNPDAHFVPTSGSTHKVKWIPYTKRFKEELWKASSVWIHDLYERYPAIKKGKHYWSLSWMPEDMRAARTTNDLDFFAGIEKYLLEQTMAIDESVANLPTLKDSLRQNLLSLIENDVTLVSVWSPTFLLEILEQIFSDKEYFLNNIKDSKKKKSIEQAEILTPELMKILFPDLILISAWATSSSKLYARKLQDLFPDIKFEAKGLWATEGVVTIPFEGKFPLALNSHFYEFEDVVSGVIYPSWSLKSGMKVSPLITTGSLFFRYKLHDLLLVTGFLESTPCFEFLGRQNTTDLVGEKISSETALKVLNELREEYAVDALSLIAVQGKTPYYRLLVDGLSKMELVSKLTEAAEKKLLENFHYKLARELNQLHPLRVVMMEDAYLEFIMYKEKSIALKGNIKIEPLILVTE
ncbi:MAG: GH3 auxin-responsive promoter family protein [Rhizobacter sp.]|nr:GH3 auxin-responsive promoter family protein [Bacteriovorax sp.]